MKFSIDLPDGNTIQVEGNFATEDTLSRLSDILENSFSGASSELSKVTKAAATVVKSFDNINDSFDDLENDINDISAATQSYSKVTDRLSRVISSATNTIGNFRFSMKGATGGNLEFSNTIESMGNSVGGALGLLPGPIGKIASGFVTATAGVAGFAIGMVEGLRTLNKNMFDAGMSLTGGLDSFVSAAEEANLPVNEFGNALLNSVEVLRLFSGGAPGGIKHISRAYKEMGDEMRKDLFAMGYSVEDIISAMADYGAAANLAGSRLSTQNLAKGTGSYLRNIRELSRLTGIDIKTAKQRIDQDRANLFIQKELATLSEKQRLAAESFLGFLPNSFNVMKDFIISGRNLSEESGLVVSQMPILSKILRETYLKISKSGGSFEDAQKLLRTSLVRNRGLIGMELARVRDTFGIASPELIRFSEQLGMTAKEVIGLLEAAEGGKDSFDTFGKNIGGLAGLLGTLSEATNQVISLFQNTFFDLVKTIDSPIAYFISSIGSAAEWLAEFKKELKSFFDDSLSPDEQLKARNALHKRLSDAFTMIWDNTIGKMLGLFERLGNTIKDAIYDGLADVLNAVGLGLGIETREEKSKRELNEIRSLIADINDVEQSIANNNKKIETSKSESDMSWWDKLNENSKEHYVDLNTKYNERLSELSTEIKKIKPDLTKTDDEYIKLQKEAIEQRKQKHVDYLKSVDNMVNNRFDKKTVTPNNVPESKTVPQMDSGGTVEPGKAAVIGEIGPEIVHGPVSVTSRFETSKIIKELTDRPSKQINESEIDFDPLIHAVESGNTINRNVLESIKKFADTQRLQANKFDTLIKTIEESNRINRNNAMSRA